MEVLLILVAYGLPVAWAIVVLARLRENNRLLGRIADDITALRKANEQSGKAGR